VTFTARARRFVLPVLLLSTSFWSGCKDLDIPTPLLSFNVNTLTFPPTAIGDTATASVTLSTTTSETIGLALTDTANFPYTTTCTPFFAAGTTCSVTVQFQPKLAGNLIAWLSVNSKSGATASIQMTGTGVAVSN
jgi:centrosomal CEP192-like protein